VRLRYLMSCLFQALNTLGSTKWRVNKRVLSIIDRIWSSGGRLGDLVDRSDVSWVYFL
jgi:DNA-directed RNA polymerase, mitochondrial